MRKWRYEVIWSWNCVSGVPMSGAQPVMIRILGAFRCESSLIRDRSVTTAKTTSNTTTARVAPLLPLQRQTCPSRPARRHPAPQQRGTFAATEARRLQGYFWYWSHFHPQGFNLLGSKSWHFPTGVNAEPGRPHSRHRCAADGYARERVASSLISTYYFISIFCLLCVAFLKYWNEIMLSPWLSLKYVLTSNKWPIHK